MFLLGLSGASDSDVDFEDADSKDTMEVDSQVTGKEGLGIESLLDDTLAGQDVATSKLSDAAALAESFQPKGNTLESTKVYFHLELNLNNKTKIEISTLCFFFEWK